MVSFNARKCLLRLQGSGAALPALSVSSDELDRRCGRREGWTASHFSIASRYVAGPEETSSTLGAKAASNALEAAGWQPCDVDVIVGACGVMEQPIPGTACLIQKRLGLGRSGVPAFDINATCLSFLVALDTVAMGFTAGRWRRALIVSADIASAALDDQDAEASVIFGDGAAAVAVEAVDGPSALIAFRLETYGEGAELCRLEAGGTRLRPKDDLQAFMEGASFRMDGPGVFRATARRFNPFLRRLMASARVGKDDIDLVVPHQASAAALSHLRRTLPWADTKVVDIFTKHGNQIAASLPTALHDAISSGRLVRGNVALLVGTAAGVSLGGAVIRY